MRFVKTADGGFINTTDIVRVTVADDLCQLAILRNGDTVMLEEHVNVAAIIDAEPVVPAGPGYFVLSYYSMSFVDRAPVVAWRIVSKLCGFIAEPVAPYELDLAWRAILYPDGRLVEQDFGERQWANEAEWLGAMRADAAERERKRAEGPLFGPLLMTPSLDPSTGRP